MWCGACVAPIMAAAPEKRVRASWVWYRAVGWNEASSWDGPNDESTQYGQSPKQKAVV